MRSGPAFRHIPFLAALAAGLLLAACASRTPPAPAPRPAPSASEAAKPRWQPVPAVADGKAVPGGRAHVVKPGETGLAIAAAYKVPWRVIAAANGIGYDSIIRVGQTLFVPTGTRQAAGPSPPKASGRPGQKRPDPEALARSFALDIDELVSGSAVAAPAPPAALPERPALARVPALAWPVDGRVILSGFGPKPGGLVNEGINIRAVRGGAVRAAAPGTVLYVGDAIPRFGLLVLLRHEGGAVTAYGHLEDALVSKGATVERGALIGRAGASGAAREPQLMFQLRLGRKAVDPLPYLRSQA
ncbi:peptidoglycan DD-metalloendopeptidase family protein [Thermaurantiacus sp.]